MKKLVHELMFGRNAKMNLLLVGLLALSFGLGCFGSNRSNAKPIPSEFYGNWQGADGSVISIRSDNSGDYKKGTYTVENATVQLDDDNKSLQFKFLGVSAKALSIENYPSGNSMKLGGVTYKRDGAGNSDKPVTSSSPEADKSPTNSTSKKDSDDDDSTVKADASKGEMPGDAELQEMVKKSLLDFNDAVQQGDFTDFHGTISKLWQRQTTPERFNQIFAEFIDKKIDISVIESESATFTPAPYIEKESGVKKLIVEGTYPTYRPPVKFSVKYIPDGKEWKLFGIEVDTTGK